MKEDLKALTALCRHWAPRNRQWRTAYLLLRARIHAALVRPRGGRL